MPILPCQSGGKSGHRWGHHGKCYTGRGSTSRADDQAAAAHANGWTGHADFARLYAELDRLTQPLPPLVRLCEHDRATHAALHRFCQDGENKGKPGPCPDASSPSTPTTTQAKPDRATPPTPAPQGSDGAATPATAAAHKQLAADVTAMVRTKEGRATLRRGAAVGSKVKAGIAAGVKAAIGMVDEDSYGAATGLLHTLSKNYQGGKLQRVIDLHHAASQIFRSIFTNVYQEVFENALSGHAFPLAHMTGKIGAKVAVAGQNALLKAVVWSWGKATGQHAEAFADLDLTDADQKFLSQLLGVVKKALAEVYAAAGIKAPEVDEARLMKRIVSSLLASSKQAPAAESFSEGNNSLDNVEIFAAGEHRGKQYTTADLDDMVRNFDAFCTGQKPGFRVPLVIGHEESQAFLDRSDLPAAGWCRRIWRDGDRLYGDFEDVPEKVARLLRAKAYRTVSSEIYDQPPEGIDGKGKMLRRVALLGADIPQLKELDDIPLPTAHAEDRRFARWQRVSLSLREIKPSATPGAFWCFNEARPRTMSLQALLAALKTGRRNRLSRFAEGDTPTRDDMIDMLGKLGVNTAPFKDVPDEALAEMLRALTDDDDQFDDDPQLDDSKFAENDPTDGLAAHALDNLPAPKDMAEKKRFAEYAKKYGERVRRHAERAKRYMEKYCDVQRNDDVPPPKPPAKPDEEPVDKHREAQELVSLIRKEIRTAIEGNVAASIEQLQKFKEEQEQSQKKLTVESFCEAQLKAGRLTAAEYTSKVAGGPDGSVYRRLMRASTSKVVKFTEGGKSLSRTDLEDQMKEIEDRPTLFGERFRDPQPIAGGAADGEAVVAAHFDKFSEDYRRAGFTRDKFLAEYKALNDANKALMLEDYRKSLQA